jgi:hypothetical protein
MLRQRENNVWSLKFSISFAYIAVYKYGVNFTASMITVFKLTIFNYYFVFLNRPDTFKADIHLNGHISEVPKVSA